MTDEELKAEARGMLLAGMRVLTDQFRSLNARLAHQLATAEPTTRLKDVTASVKMVHDMMLATIAEARTLGTTKPVRPARPVPMPRRGPEIVPPPGAPRNADDLQVRTGTYD